MPAREAIFARLGSLTDWAIPRELLEDSGLRLRARVLVGAAQTLLVVGLVTSLLVVADGEPIAAIGIGAAAICHLLAIVLLRVRKSIEGGALFLSTGIVLCSAFFAAHEGGLYVTTGAWLACVPLLTAFLCGGRMAMIAAALVVLAMFGVWLVHANGLAFRLWDAHELDYAPAWFSSVAAHFVVALFAWRYSVERAATLDQLETTVSKLEEHRDRLASVLESADAAILSTDRELRITASNAGARALGQLVGASLDEGICLLDGVPGHLREPWRERMQRVLAGEAITLAHRSSLVGREYEVSILPVGEGEPTGLTLFARDITKREEATRKLAATRRELVELSRVAGMADVATGVLHNVGNALNSAKTSSYVVRQRLDDLGKPRLSKLVELLPEDPQALAQFIVDDPRGGQIVRFLREVAAQSQRTAVDALGELERLRERLDHIHHIVGAQQALARGRRLPSEECDPRDLVRLAVDLVAGKGAGEVAIDDAEDLPRVVVDRHKVIQIVGNLVANAREAARDSGVSDPRVAIRTTHAADGIRIEVADNGVGMEPATLHRVFEHGFTTKSYGHGFGLHTAAIQIEELGGRITAHSDGLGLGSTFVVDLPMAPPRRAA